MDHKELLQLLSEPENPRFSRCVIRIPLGDPPEREKELVILLGEVRSQPLGLGLIRLDLLFDLLRQGRFPELPLLARLYGVHGEERR